MPVKSTDLSKRRRGRRPLWAPAAALGWLVAVTAHAENWPQWRGPRGDGTSLETKVPTQWGPEQNVAWKTALPGEGHSSPVVWDQSVFVTSALKDSGDRLLIRVDATTGKILWHRVVLNAGIEAMHRENSAASSTPVTDGELVFTSFQNGPRVDVRCFDRHGKQLWVAQPLRFEGMHGYSYTPVLYRDLVIVDFSQNDEAAVIALDKKSGRVRWRFDRGSREISHVTPLLVNAGGIEQLIVCGSDEIRSFDPASGKSRWWCRGPTEVCVAGLAFGDGVVFATGGYPRRTRVAVKADGSGDVTSSHLLWSLSREVSYVPSPVYHAGYLYTVVDEGRLYCFDAKTGQAVWDQRLGGRFRASLVLADGNLYATNDQGVTTVARATPEGFQPVAVNDLREFCYATPAISNGRLFIRTGANLYCIEPPPVTGAHSPGTRAEGPAATTTR
jgi:outer membrane protein assembly factor BamB